MTELEQIAYDNGVACGFLVARGIYKTIVMQTLLSNNSDDYTNLTNNTSDLSLTELSD